MKKGLDLRKAIQRCLIIIVIGVVVCYTVCVILRLRGRRQMANDAPIFDKLKKAVTTFLRVRWYYKVFLAFGTGVYTGMWTYRKVHVLPEWSDAGALAFAILKGVVATAFTLLVLFIIRTLIRLLIRLVQWFVRKMQDRSKG